MKEAIDRIKDIKCPEGNIPFWMKITCSHEKIAEMTFEATKIHILRIIEELK